MLKFQYTELPHNASEFHAMVQITANSVIDAKKPPVSMLYVIDTPVDVSLLRRTMEQSLKFIRPVDQISIISDKVIVPWTYCTDVNKEHVLNYITHTRRHPDFTNLVLYAVEHCRGHINAHMVVLTDTQEGNIDDIDIVSSVPVRIHTMGYNKHNSTLLQELADYGKGTYNFLQSMREVPIAFGSVLGAAFSTVLRGVTLRIKSDTLMTDSMRYVGDIYADEKKQILIPCTIDKTITSSTEHHTLKVTVTGMNVISKQEIQIPLEKTIVSGWDNMQDESVTKRIEEMRVVNELKKARESNETVAMLERISTSLVTLQEDIRMIIEHNGLRPLLQRTELEYKDQRDNRSDEFVSDYRTPFRMWVAREHENHVNQ
tara:strand:- start:8154 stop:9272 length:1119 start_codon:yes stop_codon:yes gene_type:complete